MKFFDVMRNELVPFCLHKSTVTSIPEEYSTSLYLYSLKQVVITVKVITKIGLNTRFVVKF